MFAAVAVPFLSHFIFALKNVVCLFGMNPVVWLRLKLKEIIQLRKDMGVSASSHSSFPRNFHTLFNILNFRLKSHAKQLNRRLMHILFPGSSLSS